MNKILLNFLLVGLSFTSIQAASAMETESFDMDVEERRNVFSPLQNRPTQREAIDYSDRSVVIHGRNLFQSEPTRSPLSDMDMNVEIRRVPSAPVKNRSIAGEIANNSRGNFVRYGQELWQIDPRGIEIVEPQVVAGVNALVERAEDLHEQENNNFSITTSERVNYTIFCNTAYFTQYR